MHMGYYLFESKVNKTQFENGTPKWFFAVAIKNKVSDGLKLCEATTLNSHSQWSGLSCRRATRERSRKPPGESKFLSAFGTQQYTETEVLSPLM